MARPARVKRTEETPPYVRSPMLLDSPEQQQRKRQIMKYLDRRLAKVSAAWLRVQDAFHATPDRKPRKERARRYEIVAITEISHPEPL